MARVTYGLVGLALIALVLGIFVFDENNTMLYLSIALSILCIALVVFGAARRAKYVSPDGEVAEEPDLIEAGYGSGDTEEVTSDEVLSAFEDADKTAAWDDEEEDEDLEFEDDEDDEEEDEEVAPRRTATKTKSKSKPKSKPKSAPKKTAAKKKAPASKAKSTRTTSKKVVVVPGRDRYHTADCRFVKGKDDTEEIASATAKRRGYEPCSVCSPD